MTNATRVNVRIGWLAIVVGAGLVLAVQVAAPVGVPLYDGVVVQEPYRYLHPGAGQVGNPTSFQSSAPISGGVLQDIVAATTESPPQVQLIAQNGAFEVSTDATTLEVSITPIEPPPDPPDGTIVGNAYRIAVTDQSGNPLPPSSCATCRTLVIRAPENAPSAAVLGRYFGGSWVILETTHRVLGMYQSNVAAAGDYALIVPGLIAGQGIDLPLIVLGGGLVVVLLAFVALMVVRQRPAPAYPSGEGRRDARGRPVVPKRIPSKRKGGRRPPSGRSDP